MGRGKCRTQQPFNSTCVELYDEPVTPKPVPTSPKHSGGRRKGTTVTRDALLDAALELFAERGYEGASLRAITAKAGVDVAMVSHFFGDKQGLFAEAVLRRGRESMALIADIDPDQPPAARVLEAYFSMWESPDTALTVRALFRAALESEDNRQRLQELISSRLLEATAVMAERCSRAGAGGAQLRPETVALRTQLMAAHLLGIGIARYIMKLAPIADTPREVLIASLEPVMAAYLPDPRANDRHRPDPGPHTS